MVETTHLKDHIEQSSSVESRSLILAEWNLNIVDNIEKIGNYRYRPVATTNFTQRDIAETYNPTDSYIENNVEIMLNDYTGATDSDIVIDGGYDEDDNPIVLTPIDKKKELLFSLEQCFDRFRPRSGINKMIYSESDYINDASTSFAQRPRYYMASREDKFKYWTSIRTEESKDTGISQNVANSSNVYDFYINDACPFVVYKNNVPSNRIVVKVQTNVGTENLGTVYDTTSKELQDPFYGVENMTVPKNWEIQYLDDENNWQTAKAFTQNIFDPEGYLELQYGLIVPEQYTNFVKAPNINSVQALPDNAPDGYSYLLIENTGDKGTYFTRNSSSTNENYPGWDVWTPTYGWFLGNEELDAKSPVVSSLTDPEWYYADEQKTKIAYREFSHLKGLRLKVTTMNKNNSRLDLIELSPRLAADLSYITRSYSVSRNASDVSSSPFPVGSLVASNGSIDMFDYDLAFSNQNTRSILNIVDNNEILYNISNKNMQVKFYEIVENVAGRDYYVPIKVMYSEGFPEVSASERSTNLNLKDLFFYFESMSPQDTIMIDQPLSYIISTLLDSIGFSNYVFLRGNEEKDDIIPYFFISKEAKVSQVLNELAVATQSAMYFDETNNFVVASRAYMFPRNGDRGTDIELNGSKDYERDGAWRNKGTQSILANIKEISSQQEDIYNDGKITYSPKYIQKTVKNIEQASKLDKERTWIYKPVMLWEVSQSDTTKSINGEASNSQGMALTAIPLAQKLSAEPPSIDNGQVVNNVIYFGDSVYFLGRYKGYFYANGEIIRYDAVEYVVPHKAGTAAGAKVWVTSLEEYEDLFAKIPFNGKLYPTGRVRIYTELKYNSNDQIVGIAKHGRGQFQTPIVEHTADIAEEWTKNFAGCEMDMKLLLNGGKTVLSTAGSISSATDEPVNGVYTAFITNLRSSTPFKAGQEIFASKVTTLSETGTIYDRQQTSPYKAKIKDLVSSDLFYVNQKLDCNDGPGGVGGFGSGNTVTVTAILSKTEIEVSASNVALTNGPITNINAYDDSGEIQTSAIVVSVSDGNVNISSSSPLTNGPIGYISTNELPIGGYELAGKTQKSDKYAKTTTINGLMKNYLSSNLSENPETNSDYVAKQVQSSALVLNGPSYDAQDNPIDFMTYSYKKMSSYYKHFGTRMRIIGKVNDGEEKLQSPVGSAGYTTIDGKLISGASGGLAVLLNPNKNVGYYFEIAAFTDNNVVNYTGETSAINNVFFYKLRAQYDYVIDSETPFANGSYTVSTNGDIITASVSGSSLQDDLNVLGAVSNETIGQTILIPNATDKSIIGTWRIEKLVNTWSLVRVEPKAVPETLWAGLTSIITDSGQFSGAGRMLGDENPSVYDLGVEYVDEKDQASGKITKRTFSLYINHIKVGEVVDTDPSPAYDNIGLFTRGSARVMFENFYALTSNYSDNTQALVSAPMSSVFSSNDQLSMRSAFKKYALSGAIQSTYLSSIGTDSQPAYNMYYEEFGTIMREAAYFNIRYEDAYPALKAMVAPTLNTEKGYTISGFQDSPYGAEFLIFNNTDTVLAIDETTGNFLRILGVTFTQQSSHDLTVDEYFNEIGNPSNVNLVGSDINLNKNKKRFQDIKNSRSVYGIKQFNLESPYIQSKDTAEKIMDWTLDRLSKPRKAMGLSVFPNPLIQIGDIISVDYKDSYGMDIFGTTGSQFVVYSIEYQKEANGPSMVLHVSEVV